MFDLVYLFNSISTLYGLFNAKFNSFGLVWFDLIYLFNGISTPYGLIKSKSYLCFPGSIAFFNCINFSINRYSNTILWIQVFLSNCNNFQMLYSHDQLYKHNAYTSTYACRINDDTIIKTSNTVLRKIYLSLNL